MLIGITGLAGSGKSEVARVLMEEFGFVRVKFADPLKNMCRALIRDAGVDEETTERYVEGDLKGALVPGLDITARWLMQTVGTEWGRDTIRQSFWTDLWQARVDATRAERVLVDDVRFPNEVATVIERRGVMWRVERPGVAPGRHPSETFIASLRVDTTIDNHGTLKDLALATAAAFAFA